MISDRNCAEAVPATGAHQFGRERSTVVVCYGPLTRPLRVARTVHLEIAPEEMRPTVVVHRGSPESWQHEGVQSCRRPPSGLRNGVNVSTQAPSFLRAGHEPFAVLISASDTSR